ncbi:MAG: HAD family hydrolase [Acidimicrobiia bacterium]
MDRPPHPSSPDPPAAMAPGTAPQGMAPPGTAPSAPVRGEPLALPPFDAVSLDVGGVLVVPDHGIVANALDRAGVPYDRGRFFEGHYRAMAAVDRCLSEPEHFTDYAHGFVRAVGVPDGHVDAAAAALEPVLASPVWLQRVPGGLAAARRLAAAGLRLAVTSNADGTVADLLARHELAQVGDGEGVPVEHITDSGVLGVGKPDPSMFLATARGLGLPPERICHVGDSHWYDASGALGVGMVAVHVDPLGLCPHDDHAHAGSLADFADRLLAARG